ncbi:hypothetical protein A6A27_39370 [Micromonospora sp. CB01531]|nr:hypothetical protein A6A27_39370 [Micromonospora sp. CB01531]
MLHPPYTAWHVSYAVIGAVLAPRVNWLVLGATALAFFLAVGLAAHALDELNGRPLGTSITDRALWAVAVVSLVVAVALGVVTIEYTGPVLIPFIVVGVFLVLAYNLELLGGRFHTDFGFAAAWGGFPVIVGFVAQAPPVTAAAFLSVVAAALGATALSHVQRRLSTPARTLRRRAREVTGAVILVDGARRPLDRETLLAPLDGALRTLSYAVPLLAVALVFARLAS